MRPTTPDFENLFPDVSDELVRDVYAAYGLAMYLAQNVEMSFMMLVIGSKITDPPSFTKADHDALWDDLSAKTMGRRLGELRKGFDLPPQAVTELQDALARRNRLAHGYFYERATEFALPDGCALMLRELEADQDFFVHVDEQLTQIYQDVVRPVGLTDEAVIAMGRLEVEETAERLRHLADDSGASS